VSSGRLIFDIDGAKVQKKRCKIRNNINTFIIFFLAIILKRNYYDL
jgi:hypothetical protein